MFYGFINAARDWGCREKKRQCNVVALIINDILFNSQVQCFLYMNRGEKTDNAGVDVNKNLE